jgi:3-hydroxyisobutyrate dehydrogenase-like beta-hydroxyacid dehydrogenase
MANVGYIGLGAMGGMMVERLLDKGHRVTGYNRTRSKAERLIEKHMHWADTPAGVARASDVILSMVSNDAALLDVAGGPDGMLAALQPGQIWADMSTVGAATARSLVEQVRATGADMVDAPVSGSTVTLKKGELLIMVGGRADTFARLQPLLADIGRKVLHVGDNGNGLICKIATNLSLAVQMLAYSEGILLAEKSGIPREIAVEVLSNGVIASPMVQYRSAFCLKLPDEALFNVNMQQKDMLLALDMGRKLNVPLPTTSVANEFLTAARGMGFADKDFAVVFNVLAALSGVEAKNL